MKKEIIVCLTNTRFTCITNSHGASIKIINYKTKNRYHLYRQVLSQIFYIQHIIQYMYMYVCMHIITTYLSAFVVIKIALHKIEDENLQLSTGVINRWAISIRDFTT